MSASSTQAVDAIVVGGNLAGLFFADTLAGWGFRTVLVERSAKLGGWDRSFENRLGSRFDLGVHALAYRRSELVTRFFEEVLDHAVRKVDVRRAIVLRGHVIPYHVEADQWPDALRALLPAGEIVDDLGTDEPTRERLGRIYGPAFADLIFDEVLASYPAERRHLELGVPESKLLTNIHPWFFPRARRPDEKEAVGGRFQDRIRRGELPEQALYPAAGYFGAFPEALERRLRERGAEVIAGADDLALDFDGQTGQVRAVVAGGRRLSADRVYWCGSSSDLYCQLGQQPPVAELSPDRFVLASLELEQPVRGDWTEILVADPEHWIDRISFRGHFAGLPNRFVQLEFAYPAADTRFEGKEADWLERCTRSLVQLGILQPENTVQDFDLKVVPVLYNAFGIEGQAMPELLFDLPLDSNLRPVLPTLKKVNINTRLPEYLRFLADDLG